MLCKFCFINKNIFGDNVFDKNLLKKVQSYFASCLYNQWVIL